MASLIEELQRNIVNDAVPVTTVLRQIKLAAAKLQLQSVEEWVQNELDGYKTAELPTYRTVSGVPRAHNPYNGWIPIIFDTERMLELISECRLYHPLSVLEGWVSSKSTGTLTLTMPSAKENYLRSNMQLNFEVALFVDRSVVKAAVSAVRDKALDWVVDLEKSNITGHGFSFSEAEKERAAMTINNFGNMTGAIGNHNTTGAITSGPFEQIQNIISQTEKHKDLLKDEGVDAQTLAEKLRDLEAATASRRSNMMKDALEALRSTLSKAAGGAIATGLIQMISQIPI